MPMSRMARWVPPLPGSCPAAPPETRTRTGRGHAEVARNGQLEAGPHRIPVDRGDHRFPASLGGRGRVAPQLEIGRGQVRNSETSPPALNALPPAPRITTTRTAASASSAAKMRGELVPHGDRHRVHLRLAVDPEGRDGARARLAEIRSWSHLRVLAVAQQPAQDLARGGLRDRGDEDEPPRPLELARSPLVRQWRSRASAVSPGAAARRTPPPARPSSSGSPITAASFTPAWRASTSRSRPDGCSRRR